MNFSLNKSWTHSPVRRGFSLFIAVVWLVTGLQPCVMASVISSDSPSVETHQTNHANHEADSDHPSCSHCGTSGCDDNHCGSEFSNTCDDGESCAYNGRSKPIDHEKFYDQYQPLKLLYSSEDEIQAGQLVASEIRKSPPLFQGPKLADLFCVYLK